MPNTIDYDPNYVEASFRIWYESGSPALWGTGGRPTVAGTRFLNSLPPDLSGRKPTLSTVRRWTEVYGWRERSDALDAQVSIKLDKEAVQKRINVLKKLAESGEALMEKGLKFIQGDDPFIDNPSAAVRAVIAGAEMQFKYTGAAERLAAISQMSDKQIEQQILFYLGKESNETNETNENEEIVDSTLEDIPSEDDTTENDNS